MGIIIGHSQLALFLLFLILRELHHEVTQHANSKEANDTNDFWEHTDTKGLGYESNHKSN